MDWRAWLGTVAAAAAAVVAGCADAATKPLPDEGKPVLRINAATCNGCGACRSACPAGAVIERAIGQARVFYIDRSACCRCGACLRVCETGSVEYTYA